MTFPGAPDGLRDALLAPHSVRIRMQVLTLAGKETGQDVTPTIVEGQVNVDASAQITRSMTATFFDPDRQLVFDPDSPADGALYADRMIRVKYGVREPGGEWLEVPIFTGPIVSFSRNGSLVDVECQGKEFLALGATWRLQHHGKHREKDKVIRDILEAEGERFFAFEKYGAKLPDGVTQKPDVQPWVFAKKVEKGMDNAQLFYDGAGRCRLRHTPKRTAWTFRTGNGGSILTPPVVTFDAANLKNAVDVKGRPPKRKGGEVIRSGANGRAVAPARHPFSPLREDRERPLPFLAEFIDDSTIKSDRDAKKVARNRLDQLLTQHVSVECDTLVVPHLEENDPVRFVTDDFAMKTRLTRFTIPLTASGSMSVGYNRKVDRPKRSRR